MIRLALFALALSAPMAFADGVALPTGFDGLYAPEGLPCLGTPRIAVGDGMMRGDDWVMTVTDLIEFPGDPNKVEASLAVSFDGRDTTESVVITLSGSGEGAALVFDYPDGTRNIWARCA